MENNKKQKSFFSKFFFGLVKSSIQSKIISSVTVLCGLGFHYVVLPNVISNVATTFISEDIGVNVEFGDWRFKWFQAEAVSTDIIVRSKSDADAVVEIVQATLDFNAFTLYFGGGWREALVRIDIESPTVNLHNDKNNQWNWQSLIDENSLIATLPASRSSRLPEGIMYADNPKSTAGSEGIEQPIRLEEITIKDMKVNVEKANFNFSGGSVRTVSHSSVDVSEATITIKNLTWPLAERVRGQQLSFTGRLGGGDLSFTIEGPFFNWVARTERGRFEDLHTAVWMPDVIGRATIEGVGVDSLIHFVPDPRIVARDGKLNGRAKISIDPNLMFSFDGLFYLDRVQYVLADELTDLSRSGSNIFEITGKGETKFDGHLNDEKFKPMAFMLTSLTEDVLKRNGAGKSLLVEAAKQTRTYQIGLTKESIKAVSQNRPQPVQAALAALAGIVVAKGLEDELGAANSTQLGISTSKTISSSDTSSKKRKGTLLGKYWKKAFGKKDKSE